MTVFTTYNKQQRGKRVETKSPRRQKSTAYINRIQSTPNKSEVVFCFGKVQVDPSIKNEGEEKKKFDMSETNNN